MLLEDKIVMSLIDNLKKGIRKNEKVNENIPVLVFICGERILDDFGRPYDAAFLKSENNIRYHIMNLLNKYDVSGGFPNRKKHILSVISEYLYSDERPVDILTFEKLLAEISDKIVIVAESPGTFCELGAFALDHRFASNLIVINQDNPDFKGSFITKGPIKKIRDLNEENLILDTRKDRILNTVQFMNMIKKLGLSRAAMQPNNESDKLVLKNLIYELANIIEMFQPIEKYEIGEIFNTLKGFDKYSIVNKKEHKIDTYNKVIDLMEDMKLIEQMKNGFYQLSSDITCYDALFNISRREFNQYRGRYLSRVYKIEPERMTI